MIAVGCFDVTIEHQAAIALLTKASLYGSAFALLRVLTESLVRGLWLYNCASEAELEKFCRGKLDKTFQTLIKEYEAKIEMPASVLTNFKNNAWAALNGFTHTGFHQISRRHSEGRVEGNYSNQDIVNALGVAAAMGLIAAGQLIGISGSEHLEPFFSEQLEKYSKPKS
jgi:hypothetical protein